MSCGAYAWDHTAKSASSRQEASDEREGDGAGMPDSRLIIRLTTELKQSLDKLAKVTGKSRTFLAHEAVREYLEDQTWQVAEIKRALKKSDAGDFASDEEVRATRAKRQARARQIAAHGALALNFAARQGVLRPDK